MSAARLKFGHRVKPEGAQEKIRIVLRLDVLRRLCATAICAAFSIASAYALQPIACASGAPIGSFQLLVTAGQTSAPVPLSSLNQLEAGYRIQYRPASINSPDKKKARVALVLVPSEKGKIVVLEPKPADKDAEWEAPFRTSLAALVFGPQGLDQHKVGKLVTANDELVGELADYAQKTRDTEALVQAITQQQQSLDTGQSVNAAVASFANQYGGASKIDRTQPVDEQMSALLRGLNPALSAYDPLTPDPIQRASQSASLAAAVAGLFFGTEVGLGASAGAMLLNMHSLFFPRTEFRSAFAASVPGSKSITALCANKSASASRTQLAFLWATRFPDTSAPVMSLPAGEHLALGSKTSIPLDVKGPDWKLVARAQDWRLVSADGKASERIAVKVNADKKAVELDTTNPNLQPGSWKLAGTWDWTPFTVSGELHLHQFSSFSKAQLSPESQDRLIQGSGKVAVTLTGDDFEFVEKLSWKSCDDKFAQPSAAAFILPVGAGRGPQMSLETQIDTTSLAAGRYEFLIAQSDGNTHTVPFKVLPAPPQISNLPLLINTGDAAHITLRGQGLDRIQALSANGATVELGEAAKGDERIATVKLNPDIRAGTRITLQMMVKDFEQPVAITDALLVAGPKPVIENVRVSLPQLDVALMPGEMPADNSVSFELKIANAAIVNSIDLYCSGSSAQPLRIRANDTTGKGRLREEGGGVLFLAFRPGDAGQPGCNVVARAHSEDNGDSVPKTLGVIVLTPKIEAFQVTDQKAADSAYYGEIRGQNLESIARVGWDANTGLAVESIPAPVAGGGNEQSLRVAVPWPAPAPHSQLFIWLRDETKGRATTAKW